MRLFNAIKKLQQGLREVSTTSMQARYKNQVICIAVVALLSGCSVLTEQTTPTETSTAITPKPDISRHTHPPHPHQNDTESMGNEEQAVTAPFDNDTLYGLLLGEIAAQRRIIPIAIEQYSIAAQNTQDRGIAEHATRLSLYGANSTAALENAKIWYKKARGQENQHEAAAIYAELLSKAQRPLDAMSIMEEQLQQGATTQFTLIAAAKDARDENLQKRISERLKQLHEQHPNNSDIVFALAIDAERAKNHEQALNYIGYLLELEPAHERGILFEAGLLEAIERNNEAAKQLRKAVHRLPDNRRIKRQYARLLTKTNLPKAQQVFGELLADNPYDSDLILSHAMVAKENQDYTIATTQFTKLINLKKHINIATYQLGVIAEQQGNNAAAETMYRKITKGRDAVSAAQKLITLLGKQQRQAEAKQYLSELRQKLPDQKISLFLTEARWLSDLNADDQAFELLTTALKDNPDNTALRFERAISAEQLGKYELMESDFRYILLEKPNDVATLNALGYALTNHSKRYQEAQRLIEKALSQQPEDAAIIDSLGWVQFKQGQTAKAEANLLKAFEQFQDDEIAAHLIELYWVTQRPKKARRILKIMQNKEKATPYVDAIVKRLGVK